MEYDAEDGYSGDEQCENNSIFHATPWCIVRRTITGMETTEWSKTDGEHPAKVKSTFFGWLSVVVRVLFYDERHGRYGGDGDDTERRIPGPPPPHSGLNVSRRPSAGTINNARLPPFSESIDVFVPVRRPSPYPFVRTVPLTADTHLWSSDTRAVSTAVCTTDVFVRPVGRR